MTFGTIYPYFDQIEPIYLVKTKLEVKESIFLEKKIRENG